MVVFATVVGSVFGSLIGSFLNVVAYRVPARRSIVSPPSACLTAPSTRNELIRVDVVDYDFPGTAV